MKKLILIAIFSIVGIGISIGTVYAATFSDNNIISKAIIKGVVNTIASGTNIIFKTSNGTNNNEVMRITSGGMVGIGTTPQFAKLEVNSGSNFYTAFFNSTNNVGTIVAILSSANASVIHYDTKNFLLWQEGMVPSTTPDFTDFRLSNGQGGQFNTPLDIDGITNNVGIGTTKPTTQLQVASGDISEQGAGNGLILKSPGGNCFRITVADSGTVTSTSVPCP